MKAVICPVCSGTGKYVEPEYYITSSGGKYETVCHGCGGKGWVEVADDLPLYPHTIGIGEDLVEK